MSAPLILAALQAAPQIEGLIFGLIAAIKSHTGEDEATIINRIGTNLTDDEKQYLIDKAKINSVQADAQTLLNQSQN